MTQVEGATFSQPERRKAASTPQSYHGLDGIIYVALVKTWLYLAATPGMFRTIHSMI
jgi:hypothetical protein